MTEQGSCTETVRGNGIPNCVCAPAIVDREGRVLVLETCPACQQVRLDVIRGIEYAGAYVRRGDTVVYELMKQREFFST